MAYNVPLAEQTMQWLLDHPDQHQQREWLSESDTSCGTVGCFFGWAAYLDCYVNNNPLLEPDGYYAETFIYKGEAMHIQPLAATLLGLSEHEAKVIYDATNTIETLQTYVKAMANGERVFDVYAKKMADQGIRVWMDETSGILLFEGIDSEESGEPE